MIYKTTNSEKLSFSTLSKTIVLALLLGFVTSVQAQTGPVAINDISTINEDFIGYTNILTNDTDSDGVNNSTIDLNPTTQVADKSITLTGKGTFTVISLGLILFTPVSNYNGTCSVNYTVKDNLGNLSNTATLTLTITPVNDAPVAIADSVIATEDVLFTSTIDLDANDTDVDLDVLTVVPGTFTTTQGGTLVLAANGSYTYLSALNFNGTDTVNYTVTDGGLTAVATLTLNITVSLGVNQNEIAGLSIYPNPITNGTLHITSNSNSEKAVTIFDVLGKQVLTTNTSNNAVSVSNLKAGSYIVKITEDGKTDTKKIIIE